MVAVTQSEPIIRPPSTHFRSCMTFSQVYGQYVSPVIHRADDFNLDSAC